MLYPPKSGNESFTFENVPLSFTLSDFWRWCSTIGIIEGPDPNRLAEFLVARAASIAAYNHSVFDPGFELLAPRGIKLQVKSGIFRRTPTNRDIGKVRFGIVEAIGRPSRQRCMDRTQKAHPDLFVFSILSHDFDVPADPLVIDHWVFFILPAGILVDLGTSRGSRILKRPTVNIQSVMALGGRLFSFRTLKPGIIDTALAVDFTRIVEVTGKTCLEVALAELTGGDVPKLSWRLFREWAGNPGPIPIAAATAEALANHSFFQECLSCGLRTNRGLLNAHLRCTECAKSF